VTPPLSNFVDQEPRPPVVEEPRPPTVEEARPARFWAAVWSVLLALSLFGADDLQRTVLGSRWLGDQAWAIEATEMLLTFSERVHVADLRRAIDAARGEPEAPVAALPLSAASTPLPVPAAPTPRDVQPSPEPTRSAPGAIAGAETARPVRRVLLIGASSIQFDLGFELELLLKSAYADVTVMRYGKFATGLSRPDALDWPKTAAKMIDEFKPDVVIANFGGNDAQSMIDGRRVLRYGTPEWDDEYGARVKQIIDAGRSEGAQTVMIGMPIMRQKGYSKKVAHVNDVVEAVTRREGAIFLPTWAWSTNERGEYRKSIEFAGKSGPMRQSDGHHYTRLGGMYVANLLVQQLEREFVLMPSASEHAVAVRREIPSEALGAKAHYLAYVPREAWRDGKPTADAGCRPVLFLLHGAGGRWSDWSEHAHRDLQALAQEHQMILVTPEGGEAGWYVDSPILANSAHESHIVSEVVTDVSAWLPASPVRGIAGLSAGGHGAITIALKHPDLFLSASSMSGVLDLPAAASRAALVERLGPLDAERERWEASSAMHLVARDVDQARALPMLVTVGSADTWAETNRAFHEKLEALKVPHVFEETDGGHDWTYWASQLPRHVGWHASALKGKRAASAEIGADLCPR
jgi:esterase/lipase superfamily enzyme